METETEMTKRYELTIWEKAEHWTFQSTIEAKDERDARAKGLKEYPAKKYSIRDIRPTH